jgi:glucose-1-phosphate cytidylyltransferase
MTDEEGWLARTVRRRTPAIGVVRDTTESLAVASATTRSGRKRPGTVAGVTRGGAMVAGSRWPEVTRVARRAGNEGVVKAVLLAGGLGTRMREETEFRPKPMVEIGGKPVLWHLMKIFGAQGITDFVVCAGYKGEQIKEYFLNYAALTNDFTVRLGRDGGVVFHGDHLERDWTVTVADTGQSTLTAGRVERIEEYVRGERFVVTYGDGLADIDISALLAFHASHGLRATITTVRPLSRFGLVDVDDRQRVTRFREKPQMDDWVSAGFFVFEPEVFDYLRDSDDTMLEQEPLARLAAERQLAAYRHEGFWQPMDTYRESQLLGEMWASGDAPWKVWE